MNNYKISVIVPVYGVESLIEKCARSLFEQTLIEIEYIFVDDCSPDKSIEVLKSVLLEYPTRKDSTIIIKHEKNMGLPYARKTGILHAHGEFIASCDSDDWIDKDLYERMYETSKLNNSDVVICDSKKTDGNQYTIVNGGTETCPKKCVIKMLYRRMWWSLCNKIFHRTLFENDLRHPQYAMGEDMCLCLQLIHKANRVSYFSSSYYNYYLPQSAQKNISKQKCLSNYYQLKHNVDLLKMAFQTFTDNSSYVKGFFFLEFYAQALLEEHIKDKEVFELWRNGFGNSLKSVILDSNTPFKMKMKALLIILRIYPIKMIF